MSKEKQIEEMIEAIKKCSCVYTDCEQECSQCSNEELYDDTLNHIARTLYEEDYRKVTRCKDCVYSYFNPSSERYTCDREYPRRHVEEDDFCNYAKMKGGAE